MTEHEIEIRVRYSETDAMGFLHHANYFVYFELGRTELLRAQGGNYRAMEEAGLFMVVVSLECKYRKSARYDDLLRLQTRVEKITPAKIPRRAGRRKPPVPAPFRLPDRSGIFGSALADPQDFTIGPPSRSDLR
ncbi:MAG: acyl-CoA thioesterase [Planctomycetota bacterium]|nr:acyl-CoA thioesterase [Planctomycetota bacterium]